MNFSTTTPDLNDSIYDYDLEDEMCEIYEVVQFESFAIPTFFALVITLSLAGNILVLVILALYENVKSLTNIFILNLAISDLVFTTCLPFWAIYHVQGWVFSEAVCKIVSFVFFIGFYSSVLFLTVMTVYRYVVVVHHVSNLNSQKMQTGILVSAFMWMLSIVAALPSLLKTTVMSNHEDDFLSCSYETHVWQTITTFQQNIFFLVAFAVMAFCYIRILSKIKETQYKTKNRAVKLVFSIVAVFYIGWIPYNVVIFLKMLEYYLVPPFDKCQAAIYLEYAFCFSHLVAFTHCCLNPVFYAFVGEKFRSHLKSMLCRFLTRKTVNEEQPVEMDVQKSQGSLY